MNAFIKVLLGLSFSGTLLILILLLCKPFYKNKLSQSWQYYIWLIVIVRLLLPFTTGFTITEHFLPQQDIYFRKTINNYFYLENIGQKETIDKEILSDIPTDTKSKENSGNPKHTILLSKYKKAILYFFKQYFFFVWLMIAVALFIRKITQYQSFLKYIHAGKKEITSLELWEQLGTEAEGINIKTTVNLYENNLISSPLLIGFFHPCIILPSTELSNTDFRHIIRHELLHFKRKDMFYKWLVQLVICLHWFNPFLYFMEAEINRLCELSCDESLLKKLDEKGKKEYGDTLLHTVGTGSTLKSSLASVTLNEGKKLLKERMDSIMKFKEKTTLHSVTSLILSLMLCITAVAFGDVILKKGDATAIAETAKVIKKEQTDNKEAEAIFNDSDLELIDQHIRDGKVILDNDIYYILCRGATKKDIPNCSGDGIIVIVTKSGYSYISCEVGDTMVEDTTEICKEWIASNVITKTEAKLAIGLAVKFKENNGQINAFVNLKKDYKKWGITRDEDGNCYYKKNRISILLDRKAQPSYRRFYYDKNGKINIKIIRNKNGKIKKIAKLTPSEVKAYTWNLN